MCINEIKQNDTINWILNLISAKNAGGPNLWRPHRISSMLGVKVRSAISGCSACHSVIITAEGKAMTFGKNKKLYIKK